MNPGGDIPDPTKTAPLHGAELPPLPSDLPPVPSLPRGTSAPGKGNPGTGEVEPYDFRNPTLLPPRELRKLRMMHEEFVEALASRLSLYLRLDVSLKLASLQTIAYQKLVESWADPSHLTLFKLEPLRGVAIIEVLPRLGLSLVDRLMGGTGVWTAPAPEITDIERALLEQVIQMILNEWSAPWNKVKNLTPVILGHESNGRFVQTAAPETIMFVVTLEATVGDCTEKIQIGVPFVPIEGLIQQLSRGPEASADPTAQPSTKPATGWNPCFDEVPLAITAEWPVIELTAGQVLDLKIGDVIRIESHNTQQICVRLGDIPRFQGRPGTIAGKWAVELTKAINRTA